MLGAPCCRAFFGIAAAPLTLRLLWRNLRTTWQIRHDTLLAITKKNGKSSIADHVPRRHRNIPYFSLPVWGSSGGKESGTKEAMRRRQREGQYTGAAGEDREY